MLPLGTLWGASADADALALLALKRWLAGGTLSSPGAGPASWGLWVWVLGLLAMLVVAAVAQGPGRALRQLLDLSGLAVLVRAAVARLRRSGRVVAALVGATVLSWTGSEALSFSDPLRMADLLLLRKVKGLTELAFEQGTFAALTPWRDVFALGDVLVLTLAATALTFRQAADRWGLVVPEKSASDALSVRPPTFWWCVVGLYSAYRVVSQVAGGGGLPLGSCLIGEFAAVPALMVLADGLLLGWVLAELRSGDAAGGLGAEGAIRLAPGATLACLLVMPGRYLAAWAWLIWPYLPTNLARPLVGGLLRGWGLVTVQCLALLMVGLAGVLAWENRPAEAFRGYGRMLRAEGGRLVSLLAATGLAAGGLSALAYLVVLSLPSQSWVLAAADSYAHFATLPVGMVLVSALVELGGRSAGVVEVRPATVVEREELGLA